MPYIILDRVTVHGANAQSHYLAVSGISPVAYLGFSRAFIAKLLQYDLELPRYLALRESAKVQVSIIHHHTEMLGDRYENSSFGFAQYKGQDATSTIRTPKDDLSHSLQPTARCNTAASLIIKTDLRSLTSAAKAIAEEMRIAGGQIQDIRGVRLEKDLSELRMPGGFFITDRTDLLAAVPAQERMHKLISELSLRNKHRLNKSDDESIPWLAPMNLGYLPISEPVEINGRTSHACYAEPLLGLIQYVSTRSIETIPFWQYAATNGAFIVSQS